MFTQKLNHSSLEGVSKSVRIFLHGAVNRVHNAPWSGSPNKNVFNDRLNLFLSLTANCSRLLWQAAAAKVLSPKQLDVRWTVSVLVSVT